jgi:ribonuclease BN (tRNA processing enzyme)
MPIFKKIALIAAAGVCALAVANTRAVEPAAGTPPVLELVVLGSGGPGATGRAGSCFLILLDGAPRILVDAGPGAFARLGEAKLSLAQTDIVLLTHLHVDHAGELPGLVKARAVSSRGPIRFQVFGPAGSKGGGGEAGFPSTSRFVDLLFGKSGAFGYLRDFAAPVEFRVTDLPTAVKPRPKPRQVYSEAKLAISAIAGHHRDAPAVIYRVDYAGKSITFTGDIDASGLDDLRAIAGNTDLLVFNSVVLDPPGSPPVLYTLHTPPQAIGEIAESAHARRLLLSHLSPTVEKATGEVQASIAAHYRGPVTFAADGMRLVP